jgi:hypothetical protein
MNIKQKMKETKLGRILLRIKYIITYQFLMNSAHGIQINKAIDKFHAGGLQIGNEKN